METGDRTADEGVVGREGERSNRRAQVTVGLDIGQMGMC